MAREVPCIYCDAAVDPTRGDGDHVIPKALGEFREDKHFRRICQKCNNALSPCEEELVRCGPERLYRQLVLGSRRAGRRSGGNWSVGAGGMPPPKILVNYKGMLLPAEYRTDMDAVETYDHIAVFDEDNNPHVIKVFPKMSPESLRARFDALGIAEMSKPTMSCEEQHINTYERLISEALCSDVEFVEHSTMEPGPLPEVPANTECRYTVRRFRALAKIAFHYYLVHNKRGLRGNEECFAPIRAFIRYGVGDKDQFFIEAKVFGDDPSLTGMAPSRWGHILAACEYDSSIIGYVRLFYGPLVRRDDHHLILGKLRLALSGLSSFQHTYLYDVDIADTGPVGQVYTSTPRRLG